MKSAKSERDAELAKVLRDMDDLHDTTMNRLKSVKDDLSNKVNELDAKSKTSIDTLKDELERRQEEMNEKIEKDKAELELFLQTEMDNAAAEVKVC